MEELDPNKCGKRVYRKRGLIWNQCSKKVSIEIGQQWFCIIHSPDGLKEREKKFWEKMKKKEEYEEMMKVKNAIYLLENKGYKIELQESLKSQN